MKKIKITSWFSMQEQSGEFKKDVEKNRYVLVSMCQKKSW